MWGAKEEQLQSAREAGYALVLAALLAVLIIQLFSLQVTGHRRYLSKSFGNKIQTIPLVAPRGEIYDRAGRPLAVNRTAYALKYFPPEGEPVDDEALKYIAGWLGTDFTTLAQSVAKQKAVLYAYQPVSIASRMTLAQVAYVEENRHLFPGCFVETNNFERSYLLGAVATHLLGYTALSAEDELAAKKAAGYLANEFVGKTGVERQFESTLRGGLGSRYIEVDRNRFFKRIVVEHPPTQGQDLYLTIDTRLQQAAYDALGGRRGDGSADHAAGLPGRRQHAVDGDGVLPQRGKAERHLERAGRDPGCRGGGRGREAGWQRPGVRAPEPFQQAPGRLRRALGR